MDKTLEERFEKYHNIIETPMEEKDDWCTLSDEQILKFVRQEVENICRLIDKIELGYKNTSLEEWKAFKHIRNAIRDKYMPKRHSF